MKYLTKRGLDGLKAYQYKASGYTYLDNLHRPFLDCEHRSPCSSCCVSCSYALLTLEAKSLIWSVATILPPVRSCSCPGAATKLPLWLAPNLITLMGTMALVASYLTSAYYTPDFKGEPAAAAEAAPQVC
jgi:hypothetical protein